MRQAPFSLPRWQALPLVAALLVTSPLAAQLPTIEMSSVYPPGGKQGTAVDVKVSGNNLDELNSLHFNHPGITAQQKVAPADEVLGEAQPVTGEFTITIAGNVPPGCYEVRARGLFGTSNPRTFVVGGVDEIRDDNSNKSLEKALVTQRDTVVNGIVDNGSRDYYSVELKAGERILADCYAQRVDSKLDATVTVYAADGQQLGRVRGGLDKDPVLDFKAPSDGTFIFAVSDFFYRGGNEYFYRLKLHNKPRIDFVLPAAGVLGSNSEYKIYGRNLPGGTKVENVLVDGQALEWTTRKINIPGNALDSNQTATGEYLITNGALTDGVGFQLDGSNTVAVGISNVASLVEQDDNDEPAKAQKITVPCDVTGQFFPARDTDYYEFEGKKGQVVWVEVISHRLGLDTDPYLVVQRVIKNDKGEEQVSDISKVDDLGTRNAKIGSDFDTTTDDPMVRLALSADATYRLRVRDQFGDGRSDPRMLYRLVVRPETPDFRMVAIPTARRLTNNNVVPLVAPVIRKGGSAIIKVAIARQDNFAGDIEISADQLPAGVTCAPVFAAGNIAEVSLILNAEENAQVWNGPIKIVGKATINGESVTRSARPGTVMWGSSNRTQEAPEFRVARDLTLAVVADTDPASIKVGDGNVIETSRGGKVEIPVAITRRNDFKADMKLSPVGAPNEFKPKDITVKGNTGTGKLELAITNNNTKPGTYSFCMKSDAKFKYARNPESVKRAEERLKKVEAAVNRVKEEVTKATAARDAANKKMQGAKDDAKKAAEEEKKQADEMLKSKQALLKRAEDMRKRASDDVNNRKKSSQPKDINVTLYSTPVTVRVHSAPFEVTASDMTVTAGQKSQLSVNIQKRFQFDDAVELTLEIPKGVAGVSASKVKIEKGKGDAKLEIAAADKATVGEHEVTVKAKGKFNNVNVENIVKFKLKVAPK